MKLKVSTLEGIHLDYAVALCEGLIDAATGHYWDSKHIHDYKPSSQWTAGGPIIEREGITLNCKRIDYADDGTPPPSPPYAWYAYEFETINKQGMRKVGFGNTPLLAAMRCYVMGKLGVEIDIPDKFITT